MRRNLIKQGAATLTVSLPARWRRKFNLSAGNEVDMVEQDQSIVITAGKPLGSKRAVVDLSGVDALLKRIFAARYLQGADEIEVRVDSPAKARIIAGRVREMIGMEVIQQSRTSLLVKDMAPSTESAIDPMLRRVFFMTHTVADETLKALRSKEKDLDYLADMEANINRFTDHCFRLLNKHGYTQFAKTAVVYTIVLLLEQLADEYKQLISFVQKHSLVVDPQEIELLAEVNAQFRRFEELFNNFDNKKAITIAQEHDALMKAIEKRASALKSTKELQVLLTIKGMAQLNVRMMGQALTSA